MGGTRVPSQDGAWPGGPVRGGTCCTLILNGDMVVDVDQVDCY